MRRMRDQGLLRFVAILLLLGCSGQYAGKKEISTGSVPASGLGPLSGRIFGDGSDVLIIVLHGDISRGGTAESMYPRAAEIAGRFPHATVVALLRPGYEDNEGRRSPGRTFGRRDHYTPVNNAAVADTILNLKAATGAERVLAMGFSGGAAQLGAVLGSRPGLVDAAILLSCPCDIAKWRQLRGRGPWPRSQSPIALAGSVALDARVIAITGEADTNTFPVLAQDYVDALKARGIVAELRIVPKGRHKYSDLRDAVLAAFDSLM